MKCAFVSVSTLKRIFGAWENSGTVNFPRPTGSRTMGGFFSPRAYNTTGCRREREYVYPKFLLQNFFQKKLISLNFCVYRKWCQSMRSGKLCFPEFHPTKSDLLLQKIEYRFRLLQKIFPKFFSSTAKKNIHCSRRQIKPIAKYLFFFFFFFFCNR